MTKAQQTSLDQRNYLALSIARHLAWSMDASGSETATMPFTCHGTQYEVTVKLIGTKEG